MAQIIFSPNAVPKLTSLWGRLALTAAKHIIFRQRLVKSLQGYFASGILPQRGKVAAPEPVGTSLGSPPCLVVR